MSIQVQLQKKIDAARAELARLEQAASVLADLNGHRKQRILDRAVDRLTTKDAATPLPPALDAWMRTKISGAQSKVASLAVVHVLTEAQGHRPSRVEVLTALGLLGHSRHQQAISRRIVVKQLAQDRKGLLHLTAKGQARLAPFLEREEG